MKCEECNHIKRECDCFYCCSIAKIGCMYCVLPILGYRQVKKIVKKIRK